MSNLTPPDYYKVDLQECLDSLQNNKAHITVLNEAKQHNELLIYAPLTTHSSHAWPDNSLELCLLPSHKKIGTINASDHDMLISTYISMHSGSRIDVNLVPRSVTFYSNCKVAGMRLGIKDNLRTMKMSCVLLHH